jgi:hypothetical protein
MGEGMNLGEFRNQTKDLPDDAVIFMDDGTLDFKFAEVYIRHVLPPVLNHSFAVTLEMGQIWNQEFDLDARVDAVIGYDG